MLTLLAYARAFKCHKVVKSSNSLFKSNLDVQETILRMCLEVDKKQEGENEVEIVVSRKKICLSLIFS